MVISHARSGLARSYYFADSNILPKRSLLRNLSISLSFDPSQLTRHIKAYITILRSLPTHPANQSQVLRLPLFHEDRIMLPDFPLAIGLRASSRCAHRLVFSRRPCSLHPPELTRLVASLACWTPARKEPERLAFRKPERLAGARETPARKTSHHPPTRRTASQSSQSDPRRPPRQSFLCTIVEAQYSSRLADGSHARMAAVLDAMNLAFTLIFTAELGVNLLAHWLRAFATNIWCARAQRRLATVRFRGA